MSFAEEVPLIYHSAFDNFLHSKIKDETRCISILNRLEMDLVPFLYNYGLLEDCHSIYDIADVQTAKSLQNKIVTDTVLKDVNRTVDPSYTEALTWYRRFLVSEYHPSHPDYKKAYPVPGEIGDGSQNLHESEGGYHAGGEVKFAPVKHNDDDYPPDSEGMEKQYNLTKKERNPELRKRCIEFFKEKNGGRIFCLCCGFDFSRAYGTLGEDYIEVHHIVPHHTFQGEHEVDPKTDLIPLCSNCHSMIHRGVGKNGDCLTPEELKALYQGVVYKRD